MFALGCGDDDGGSGGAGTSTDTDTDTGTGTGTSSGTGTGTGCPPMPPTAASACPDNDLICEYPEADCSPRFYCEADSTGLVWQRRAPEAGSSCPTPGQSCFFLSTVQDSSGLDEDSKETAVCTTDDGWVVAGGGCFDGCTDCPPEAPADTDDCQLAMGAEFSHCLYPIEQGCGVQAATLDCPDGFFDLIEPPCN